jgi:ABC-2 type transport system permease protein
MAKILAIIKKDIRLYFASPISLVFFIVLPIMFTVVLAFTTGGFGSEEIVLSYVDQANTPLSANLVQLVEEGDGLKTEVIDLATAQAQFAEGKLDAYLVIPVDFNTETLLKGSLSVQLFQQPNRTSSQTIYQALRLALTKLTSSQAKLRSVMQVYQTLHPEVSAAELENLTDQLSSEIQLEIANAPSRLIESVSQKGDEVIYDPVTSSSAGQLITWVFIPLVGLSGAMAYERQQGTLKRFLTTPTSRLTYFSATILGQVLISLVQVFLLMIFGALILKAPWLNRPLPTFLLLLAFALASAGLGAFLGSLVKTESQASGISSSIGMIFALLSGAWFPIELFPKVMQNTAKIFPTYWGMQGLKDILISNKPIAEILPTVGILLGFAILFLSLGLIFFKTE